MLKKIRNETDMQPQRAQGVGERNQECSGGDGILWDAFYFGSIQIRKLAL